MLPLGGEASHILWHGVPQELGISKCLVLLTRTDSLQMTLNSNAKKQLDSGLGICVWNQVGRSVPHCAFMTGAGLRRSAEWVASSSAVLRLIFKRQGGHWQVGQWWGHMHPLKLKGQASLLLCQWTRNFGHLHPLIWASGCGIRRPSEVG